MPSGASGLNAVSTLGRSGTEETGGWHIPEKQDTEPRRRPRLAASRPSPALGCAFGIPGAVMMGGGII